MKYRKKVVSSNTETYKYVFQKHTKEEANQLEDIFLTSIF